MLLGMGIRSLGYTMNSSICVPRALLEALTDPDRVSYLDSENFCKHCDAPWDRSLTTPDQHEHAADCPVRQAQELLAATTDNTQAAALRQALENYGWHWNTCPIYSNVRDKGCTCGLDAALAAAKVGKQ
jgi:hypothetical protein